MTATQVILLAVSVVLFLAGGVRSMSFTAINTLTFAEVAPEQRSGATALQGTSQQVAFSLDFWWMYLFYFGAIGPRVAAGIGLLGLIAAAVWFFYFSEPGQAITPAATSTE